MQGGKEGIEGMGKEGQGGSGGDGILPQQREGWTASSQSPQGTGSQETGALSQLGAALSDGSLPRAWDPSQTATVEWAEVALPLPAAPYRERGAHGTQHRGI